MAGTAIATLRQEFVANRSTIQGAIPQGIRLDADRLINLALLAATKSPELLDCSAASIVQAVRQSAALGLEVGGPLGEAYIVKYGSQAQLIPGYRGYVTLMQRTGKVLQIEARLVYRDDTFEVEYGLDPKVVHRPKFDGSRQDEDIVAVYMVATLQNGLKAFEVMTREEVEKVRQSSKSKDRGPWRDWFPEQVKKTVIRRGAKLLPMSSEFAEAVELENRAEVGVVGSATRFDTEATMSADLREKTNARADALREKVRPATATVAAVPQQGKNESGEEYAERLRQWEQDNGTAE
ncbi:MAG: recombinase RecT [Gemmatimonadaceae bacterium]|nr:recombinase RecT [Gemmatimonadaceae bacterium]